MSTAYITYDTLFKYIDRKEVIQLTDDDNIGEINYMILDQALDAADGEIDLYLKGIYEDITMPTTSKVLQQIAADLTIYHLYKRRMRAEMPESIVAIYKDAIQKLQDIREGRIAIDLDREDQEYFIKVSKKSTDRIFPKDTLDKI